MKERADVSIVDLATTSLRAMHETLHGLSADTNRTFWKVINPRGSHAVAVGLRVPITVAIEGHVGYYAGGMNQQASICISGNAGPGVAENMMSGEVRVRGDASMAAGATGCGGLLVIEGNAGARCGISMKGIDIVVCGSVGHMSGFMAQEGNLVVCGDAGDAHRDQHEQVATRRHPSPAVEVDAEEDRLGEERESLEGKGHPDDDCERC